jgi:DNA-binding MarR family transcriptional regulator
VSSPPGGWLDDDEQRAWLAFMRLQLRMSYEMNRQLQAETALSLPDYHVLNALAYGAEASMSVSALAAAIGWERSRTSHHAKRMATRGLVEMAASADDRRVTRVAITGEGRDALTAAAPGHVEMVRRLFFDGLDPEVVRRLGETLDTVYRNVVEQGATLGG